MLVVMVVLIRRELYQLIHSAGETMKSLESPDLESRLRIIEDKLAIYELIAAHPPSADTGADGYAASVYLANGGRMQRLSATQSLN